MKIRVGEDEYIEISVNERGNLDVNAKGGNAVFVTIFALALGVSLLIAIAIQL